MSLRFILGCVGSGKTNQCIEEIINKDDHTNNLIYIVPEQFSMESEKALLRKKPQGSIINTGVYSFRHLAYIIMDKLGANDSAMLNDTGKAMLLKKTLINVRSELKLYKKSVNQKGFTDSLTSTISELMQYNVTEDKLNSAIDSLDECNLKYKLMDIEKIYLSYYNSLKGKYISAENTLEILCGIISEADIIKGSEIWIDGFKSFTPQEYNIIAELLKYSKQVNISLTTDCKDFSAFDISDPYSETKSALNRLNKIAKDNNIATEKPLILNKPVKYSYNELLHLSENYFDIKPKAYNNDAEHIKIYNASDKYDEIDMVCSEINHMIKNKKYKYEDIAVIIASQDYEKPLCNSLNRYNIPNFIDTRRDITSHPLTVAIVSALELITDNFSKEAVFSLLKTGYMPIEEKDVFLLENYVIAQNIKGRKWLQEWEYGFDEKIFIKPLIEDIRDIFLDYLSALTDNIKNSRKYTVLEISTAIFDFLKEIEVFKTLNSNIKQATESDNISSAMIDKQIWGLICDVFDKMVEFLGEEKVTPKEYLDILNTGLETATIGVIPALSDQLIVGDIERTKLPDIKALFILGVNEGALPPQRVEAGILTDLERVTLSSDYFELAPDLTSKLSQDKLNIYIALTKPTDYLYLSYSKGNMSGEKFLPSPVITKIKDIFPKINELTYNPNENMISSPLPTLDKLITNIKENDEPDAICKDLYNYYCNSELYSYKIKNILSMLKDDSGSLSIEIADSLYGGNINISASRLEAFAQCPYSFFLQFCLNAYERNEYRFENLEAGNIYHAALEQAFNIIELDKMDIESIDNDKLAEIASKSIEAAIVITGKQSLAAVPRYQGYINRMKRTMYNTLWGFSKNAETDKFRPKEFELSFGSKNGIEPIAYELENGKRLNLTGKIDRIDHLKEKDKIYIKIIDYKLSEHKLDFNEIYHGTSLQLPLYMNAYVNIMKKYSSKDIEPGGILYYHVHNPQLEEDNDIEKKTLNQLRFRGIISDEKAVKDCLKKQIISPVMLNSKNFENMAEFINKKIIETGNEMAKGNIQIKPYRYISSSSAIKIACQYCQYQAICKIDLKDNRHKYNTFVKDDKKAKKEILN